MLAPASALVPAAPGRPRLRGVLHQYAFFVSLAVAAPVVAADDTARQRLAASIFALSVAVMFGVSALYNAIESWATRLLRDKELYRQMAHSTNPYGDGDAARRIVDVLATFGARGD